MTRREKREKEKAEFRDKVNTICNIVNTLISTALFLKQLLGL